MLLDPTLRKDGIDLACKLLLCHWVSQKLNILCDLQRWKRGNEECPCNFAWFERNPNDSIWLAWIPKMHFRVGVWLGKKPANLSRIFPEFSRLAKTYSNHSLLKSYLQSYQLAQKVPSHKRSQSSVSDRSFSCSILDKNSNKYVCHDMYPKMNISLVFKNSKASL